MLARRLERIATLVLLFLTACTVFPPARTAVRVETRRVVIPGEEADTLAETSGATENALVPLHTHDGRDLWVRESALGGASLVPGTWVLVRQNGQLATVQVTRSLDDFVEVDVAGASAVVPIGDVLARLHHGPPAPEVTPPPPPAVTPPPSPPTPIGQMVVLEPRPLTRAGMLDGCSSGSARVVFHDGTDVRVPTSVLHPLRVRAGDRVVALWNDSPYPAVILETRSTLVRARWEDESEQWIDLADVQSIEGAGSGAVHGCPHRAVLVDEGARSGIGRLIACDGSGATVLDADGAPRVVPRETLARVPLRPGDPIEARWNGTPYDATVITIGERIHVRWYDGSENDVDPADLVAFRARDARPTEPASCPDVAAAAP